MISFILNTRKEVSEGIVYDLVQELFHLQKDDFDSLTGQKTFAKVRYEQSLRAYDAEFKCQLSIYVSEELCLQAEIYNDLHLALPLANKINDEVLIHDQSNDASRWILVKPAFKVFVCYEAINEAKEFSFDVDRSTLRAVSIEKVLSILPSKDYVESIPSNRPVFFNQDKVWSNF